MSTPYRIAVTGADGQLGKALQALAWPPGVEVHALARDRLDITDGRAVQQHFGRQPADLVINAAAYTAVDRAEDEPERAHAVNATGAENLAVATAARGIPIIHVSTDFVFAGDKAGAYVESDTPAPKNVYGETKLAGERAVAAANPAHVILRTSWVYSATGHNFVRTILRLAGERDRLRIVADQHGRPTAAPDLAAGCASVVAAIREGRGDIWGLYHLAGEGATTWHGFATEILARCGLPVECEAITTSEFPTRAARPANAVLACDRFTARFGWPMRPWRDALVGVLAALGHDGDERRAP